MTLPYLERGPLWLWRDSTQSRLNLESGGARARIVDINMASNGVIYSVDSVLGIPNRNMVQKLKHGLFTRLEVNSIED